MADKPKSKGNRQDKQPQHLSPGGRGSGGRGARGRGKSNGAQVAGASNSGGDDGNPTTPNKGVASVNSPISSEHLIDTPLHIHMQIHSICK